MTETTNQPKASTNETVLQQQYMRALGSFEGIILSQIDVKNKLGDRLNYSIRAGIIILGAIAFSILILLLTLTTQLNRITEVVSNIDNHFGSISEKMTRIDDHMGSMEKQVALIEAMDARIDVMDGEMALIAGDMTQMEGTVGGITQNMTSVRDQLGAIALTIDQVNNEMQIMTHEMHRMGKPARSMNKMFPFP